MLQELCQRYSYNKETTADTEIQRQRLRPRPQSRPRSRQQQRQRRRQWQLHRHRQRQRQRQRQRRRQKQIGRRTYATTETNTQSKANTETDGKQRPSQTHQITRTMRTNQHLKQEYRKPTYKDKTHEKAQTQNENPRYRERHIDIDTYIPIEAHTPNKT